MHRRVETLFIPRVKMIIAVTVLEEDVHFYSRVDSPFLHEASRFQPHKPEEVEWRHSTENKEVNTDGAKTKLACVCVCVSIIYEVFVEMSLCVPGATAGAVLLRSSVSLHV